MIEQTKFLMPYNPNSRNRAAEKGWYILDNNRTSGILMPIHSLPSPHGIGALGRAAYDFVDFLAAAGQTWWQVLPVGHTGFGDSPYQCFSAMAGNPYFIDLDLLRSQGLLAADEIPADWGADPARVDYGLLYRERFGVLAKALRRFNKTDADYLDFCRRNDWWLEDYALFMTIKEAQGGAPLSAWPEALHQRDKTALRAEMAQRGPRYEFWKCTQYMFYTQWRTLKAYANARGVSIIGDIPIYVSPDSSDLWANPQLFQLGADGRPSLVAGVPPDFFSKDGQHWGNPVYDWDYHRRTGYDWWVRRLALSCELYDCTRIDHFRGFAGYYAIPATEETARNGEWLPGPGKAFIGRIRRALPDMKIIAEDLGVVTPDVTELLAYSGYPGMAVLQFAFTPGEDSAFLPHNLRPHTVVYTGTHDNDTTAAWAAKKRAPDVQFARKYLRVPKDGDLAAALVAAAMSGVADTAVVPVQDWLSLGAEARTNTPATVGKNWMWRVVPGQLTHTLAKQIYDETATYSRLSKAAHAALALEKTYAERLSVGTVLNREQIRAAELAAAARGTSHAQLMENAGNAAAEAILSLYKKGRKQPRSALILAGKGNNAGDAFVAATALSKAGWDVDWAPLCGEEFSLLAERYRAALPPDVHKTSIYDADFDATVVIDAVFGTGFKGELPPDIRIVFRRANLSQALRVALDIPSGLDCDTGEASPDTFRADLTLTFGAYKPGLLADTGRALAGEVQKLDIGLF